MDASKASVPGAKVRAENQATGAQREAVANADGIYVFPDLPVGNYRLVVEAKGFQTQSQTGLALAVASRLTVDFVLQPGQVTEVVEVTGEAQAVEAAQGTYLGTKQLLDLPINGRDYARFSLLTPGAVARSNYISDIGFNGMHSTHNNFSIDGVDASRVDQPYMSNGYERGARLLTGSLETISEVRVQTSTYRAEYGKSAGSAVAIISKSGSNELHGSLLEFVRNDFFDARNYFNAKPAAMPALRYNNFGASLGGPIIKNKLFYFANYEGSRQQVGVTGSGTVPSAALKAQVLAASPALKDVLAQYPTGTGSTTNSLVDNYTTTGSLSVREDTGSIRVDHQLTSNDHIYARLNINDSEVHGPLYGTTTSALGVNDFQQVPVRTTNGTLNYMRVWSPRVVMETSAGIQRWVSSINSELPTPQISVTGFTTVIGSRRFSRTNSTMTQVGSSLSWVSGAHTYKFGGSYWRSGVNPYSRDLTTITYTSLTDFINNSVYSASVAKGVPGVGRRQDWFGFYVQDTWQLRPGLTVDYGLRYDLGTPNHGVYANQMYAFDTRLSALGEAGAAWYATNFKDFGPRFGLGWQVSRSLTVRAGYGIFYQQYPPGNGYNVAANTIKGNTTLLRTNIPALSYPLDSYLASGTATALSVEGFNWNKPDLYSQQWNLTLVQNLGRASTLQVAYVGNHGVNLRRQRNINFYEPSLGRRPLTQFANVNVEYNEGQSVYHGLQMNYTQRMAAGLQGIFNYTYAKVIDDTQDYGLYSTGPQDNRCIHACERGLGSGDIRHNVTYNVLYDLPFGSGKRFLGSHQGTFNTLISNWQLSSLGLVRSGIAQFISIGTNTYGNSNTTNQRPNVVAGQSIFPSNQSPTNWYNSSAFSMPSSGTFGNAGRNIGRGPDFWQFDASLAKNTSVTEKTVLQFRAEVFNLFNRPNFDFPNAVWNTTSFGKIYNTFGKTIGFGTSRQIQLSLRLKF